MNGTSVPPVLKRLLMGAAPAFLLIVTGCGEEFTTESPAGRSETQVGAGGGGVPGDGEPGGSQGTGGASPSGGGGGSAGAAGSGGNAGAGGSSTANVCPSGTGAEMVVAAGFCIDATETTNAQYAAFLDAEPSLQGQPSGCGENESLVPEKLWEDSLRERPGHPVAFVDWCDAHAYCAWSGKRLCGSRLGGAVPPAALDEAEQSEWHAACSLDGARSFPYAGNYNGLKCVGRDYHGQILGGTVPSGSTRCEGGYPGLFEMTGNVWEWENSCTTTSCAMRGGSYGSGSSGLKCASSMLWGRLFHDPGVGIRCCADFE